jgi:hypothetical protein
MSADRYLVVAHCDIDDHPISLHDDEQSAIREAGKVTPVLVAKCASVSTSRTGASGPIEPSKVSVYKFQHGKPIEVCFEGPVHVAKELAQQNENKVTGRSPDEGAEHAANQNIQPSFPSPPKPQLERKVGVRVKAQQQPLPHCN